MRLVHIIGQIKEFLKNKKVLAVSSIILTAVIFTLVFVLICGNVGADETVRYTVVFDSGEGSSVPSQNVYKNNLVMRPDDPTRSGYVFDGWEYNGALWSFDTSTVKETIILKARWCEAVTVTFDDGEQIYELQCAKGRPISEDAAPSVNDSDFLSWYLGGMAWDFANPVNSDIILCAAWKSEIKIDSSNLHGDVLDELENIENIENTLGLSVQTVESDYDISFSQLSRDEAVELTPFLRYMPALQEFLEENPKIAETLTEEDGGLYRVPALTSAACSRKLLFIRAEWIELLLNGDTDFKSESSENIDRGGLRYEPFFECGVFEIEVGGEDSQKTVTKNTNKSGNIIDILNWKASLGTLDGATAVNLMRRYIDSAYSGYYGTRRADLFIGEDAAWDADELAALIRCVIANSDFLGCDSISGIKLGTDGEYSLICLAVMLFGTEDIDAENRYINLNDGFLIYSGDNREVASAVRAVNALLSEGIITSSDDSSASAVCFFSEESSDGLTQLAYPLTEATEVTDEGGTKRIMLDSCSYFSVCNTDVSVCISYNAVEPDKKKLHAALRLIDFLYLRGLN